MPIAPEIQEIVLKNYKRGKTPITGRPADVIEPEMAKAREMVKDFTKDIGDVLIAAIYPITGLHFLKCKHGLEKPPAEVKA
jgi:pyruvate/oxaloacetate carboxyltransferase